MRYPSAESVGLSYPVRGAPDGLNRGICRRCRVASLPVFREAVPADLVPGKPQGSGAAVMRAAEVSGLHSGS